VLFDSQRPFDGKYVYHYTTDRSSLQFILPQRKLRLSSCYNTNDPRESSNSSFQLADDANVGANNPIMKDFLNNQMVFSDHLKKVGKVLCFAQDSPEQYILDPYAPYYSEYYGRGYLKFRMWAQYANNHTGICFILNKEDLISKLLLTFRDSFIKYGNVVYSTDIGMVSAYTLNTSEFKGSTIEEIVDKRIETDAVKYYFTKDPDWRDENEFRVVVRDSSSEYLHLDIDGCLEGILLGLKFDIQQKDVLKLCHDSFQNKPQIAQIINVNNNFMIIPFEV